MIRSIIRPMDEKAVAEYITKTFPDVETTEAYGYIFFFFKSDRMLPFATLIAANNDYDRISQLDRPGVFRLNIGVGRKTFESLFGSTKVAVSAYDYTALDVLTPHPDYAKQFFVCVLSPGEATWEKVRSLLSEAHDIAAKKYRIRSKG